MGQMSKKPKKFEVRKSKYVTNLWMWSSLWGFLEGYLSINTSSDTIDTLLKYRYYIDTYFLQYFPSLAPTQPYRGFFFHYLGTI